VNRREAPAGSPARAPEPFTIEGADGGPLRGDLYGGTSAAEPRPAPGALDAARAEQGRRPRGHPPLAVLCHGFRSYKDWGFMPFLAARLGSEGIPTIAFNFSGSGVADSSGAFAEPERFRRNTYAAELEDLRRVLRWAEDRLGPRAVGLAGHSRGGAIALIHAVLDPRVRAVALLATPRAIGIWPEEYYRSWERGEDAVFLDFRTGKPLRLGPQYRADIDELGDRCDVTRAMSALRVPVLIVQGDRDRQVTIEEARALATAGAANLTELTVIRGAGHGFQAGDVIRRTPPQLLEMADAVAAWMRRWLLRAPSPLI
jgi:pimeloyl-ACP methyl ester carboxylesterase